MNRLIFVDDVGGSLAALLTAVARVDGAKGFDQVEARASGEVNLDPVVGQVLSEIGIQMVPVVEPFDPTAPLGEGDVLISLGTAPVAGAHQHWEGALSPHDAPALVQRSTARIVRDALARHLALFSAQR